MITLNRTRRIFLAALLGICLLFLGRSGLLELSSRWLTEEAYSHGFIMLGIALYFAWSERFRASLEAAVEIRTLSVMAPIGLTLSTSVIVVSEIAQIFTVSQYAFLAAIFFLLVIVVGWSAARYFVPPFVMMLFVIPLPYYLQAQLTSELQLVSTKLGVLGLELLQIPVYQSGNTLDLGLFKLQVVEACAGLNYMYPLIGIAYIFSHVTKGRLWRRAVIILAAIPITIAMNGVRIVVIGILVRHSGSKLAEGFVHEFQGMVIFILCTILLYLLHKILPRTPTDRPLVTSKNLKKRQSDIALGAMVLTGRTQQVALFGNLVLATVGLYAVESYARQSEIFPTRLNFDVFPSYFRAWRGHRSHLPSETVKVLDPTDYLLLSYSNDSALNSVEVYSAYYQSQISGASIHSPKICLPGGGWEIAEIDRIPFHSEMPDSRMNRAVLQLGDRKMLVYYWFQQRGRIFASENLAKWYLLLDSLVLNRSDGALVRLSTELNEGAGDSIEMAELRLLELKSFVDSEIQKHVPAA